MKQHPILSEIEDFLSASGMAATYFGKQAAGNSELVSRLRAGGGLHFLTESRVRAFINEHSFARASSSEAAE